MNADQRLDQLEPLISEALTVLDRHTVQLKRLDNNVGQIVTILTQQSDNISFLLQEHIVIKTDVAELKADVADIKTDVAGLKTDVAGLKTDVAGLKTDIAGLKTNIAGLKTDVAGINTDVTSLKADMAGINTDVTSLKAGVAEIKQLQQAMQTAVGSKLDLILSKLA